SMYRLIIVDDEEVIRNGLRSVVDWEALGFTVVGTFPNGNAALGYLRKQKIDVVLADIRMPRLSGLDLARIVMVDMPETLVVILSGYDEFHYAQEAIDLNVFKYLLKPIKEAQLTEVFTKLKDTLDNRDPRADTGHRLEALREQAMEQWISSGIRSPLPPSVNGSLEGLQAGGRSVLLLEPRANGAAQEEQPDLLGFCATLRRVFADSVPESELRTFILRNGVRLVVVLAGNPQDLAEELFEIAQEEASTYPGLTLSAAIGPSVEEEEKVPLSFLGAERTLARRMYLGLGRLIHPEEGDHSEVERPIQLSVEGMADALVTGSRNRIAETLREAFSQLREARIISPETVRTVLLSLMVRLKERLLSSAPAVAAALPEDAHLQRELEDSCCLDEFHSRISTMLDSALRTAGDGSGLRSAVITSAVRLIQGNYATDLSLDDVAREVEVSAGYLSRLFKQVTGETFKGYLTRIRMQEAKRLLSESGSKIYEIAEAVGYNDQHYFSEVFRKETGLSPMEYRNRAVGRLQ
ncbi:MAG: helix-turn-helix domain-containing protein, partial [Spirochaetaceae bacterium]